MTSTDTSRGRHRLASPREVRRPTLLPRSATVIAATVGAVLAFGVQEHVEVPAPRPHPDAQPDDAQPDLAGPAFEPVIPAPRDGRPARIDSAALDPVPAGVTGRAIAGAHAAGSASIGALDAVTATQPHGGVAPADLFAA